MSWSSRKKKEDTFWTSYFVWRKFLKHLCFISIYSSLNTLSEYKNFTYQKSLLYPLLLLVFKIVKRLQCILNKGWYSRKNNYPNKIFQTFVVFLFQITINSYLISTIMENVCRLFHILGKFLFTADERKLWLFICITRWLYELPHELPNN